jgi:branched-subunit amino acid transport protein
MSGELWLLIAGCAVVTFAIKAAGPVALGGRDLPPRFTQVIALMAPALLAALIVTQALADGERWHVGADTAGVAAAGAVVLRGGSVVPAVAVAVVVTAGLRALGLAS